MLCRSGTEYFQTKIESPPALNHRRPQISIRMQTMIHGSNALQSSPWVSGVLSRAGTLAIVAADSSRSRSAGDSQRFSGRQTRRNRIREPIEISEAPMSTIQGL